jgi:hypothetical protein
MRELEHGFSNKYFPNETRVFRGILGRIKSDLGACILLRSINTEVTVTRVAVVPKA